MKLVKMSLAAAVLLGASAFAIDNVKVNGDAKVFYDTNTKDYTAGGVTDSGLFDKAGSSADTALRLGVTGDLLKGVSFGVTGYAISTLGLENNLVGNVWSGAHGGVSDGTVDASDLKDTSWVSELWIAGTFGKTTAKVGRMELDTPFAFSEKWSIAANTFEGAVLINQDIPDTTLIAAWVGKTNGYNVGQNTTATIGIKNSTDTGIDGIMGAGAEFYSFAEEGAYAVAAINNSFKPLAAQAWYYNVGAVADAYWLQADIDCQLVKGVKIGAQYADMSPKGLLKAHGVTKDSEAYAFKLGYEGIENLKVSAAYSKVDDEGTLKISNVGTNNLSGAQSKLYTEAWWNYGYVGAPDAQSWNVTAEYNAGFAKIGAYYTDVSVNDTKAQSVTVVDGTDMTEVALTVSKSFGPLDTTLAYISTDADDQNKENGAGTGTGRRYESVQAYLTLNF